MKYVKEKTESAFKSVEDSDFIIVVGHHPVGGATCGPENETKWLHEKIREYKASAYLSGHVHAMDFGSDENTLYMTIGTSGTAGGSGCQGSNGKWTSSKSGFGAIHIKDQKLEMIFYDDNGAMLNSASINSRN